MLNDKSRMKGDLHVRFREKFEVKVLLLTRLVGVAVQPAVIHHDIGGNRVQKLFELQVIVIPYPVKRAVPVIDLAEADHTFPVQGKGMDRQVVLQCIV